MTPRSPANVPLVTFDHVGHEFDAGRIVALKDVSFSIHEGESTGWRRGQALPRPWNEPSRAPP